MSLLGQARIDLIEGDRRSTADAYVDLKDLSAAEAFLRRFKGDPMVIAQLRASLAKTEFNLSRKSDDQVIRMLAIMLATGQLLVKAADLYLYPGSVSAGAMNAESQAAVQRPMSGYFTMLKFVLRARSFEHQIGRASSR